MQISDMEQTSKAVHDTEEAKMSEKETATSEDGKNKPVYKCSVGSIEGAVWEQEGKNGTFLTTTIVRNFKDKDDNWQKTGSMRINDLPAVQLVCQKCFEFGKLKVPELQA